MKKLLYLNQKQFSSILYDSLFGLILFFSLDSFLEISDPIHLLFYLFSTIVVVHWWLLFKAAEDAFGETRNSAIYIIINLICLILLEFTILFSKTFNYQKTAAFLLILLIVDLCWAILVSYFHNWAQKDKTILKLIKKELKNIVLSDIIVIIPLFALIYLGESLSAIAFVISYIFIYLIYVILSFVLKIIDLKII